MPNTDQIFMISHPTWQAPCKETAKWFFMKYANKSEVITQKSLKKKKKFCTQNTMFTNLTTSVLEAIMKS